MSSGIIHRESLKKYVLEFYINDEDELGKKRNTTLGNTCVGRHGVIFPPRFSTKKETWAESITPIKSVVGNILLSIHMGQAQHICKRETDASCRSLKQTSCVRVF